MNRQILAAAIKKSREEQGISQEQMAEMLDVSATHVKHIESGHRRPSTEVLFQLCKILHLSLDALLFPEEKGRYLEKQALAALSECTPREKQIVLDLVDSLIRNRPEQNP